ncbi:MAG: hypothetical protein IID40_06970 [Planctomycetes bacterium]|nr:hypothetical protein [Planctomycetota bacterium]
MLLIVIRGNAALLNVQLDNPTVFYDSTGELTYSPGTGLLSALIGPGSDPSPIPCPPQLGVDAVPIAVILDSVPVFVQSPRTFDVLIRVGTSGELLGGVIGDDLILEGVVDVDDDGVAEYSGLLLAGEVVAFGFEDTGTNTDRFDLLFEATGGALLGLLDSNFIGVTVTSEGSTFTGDFSVPFSGGAKGFIGSAQVCVINTTAITHDVGSGDHPSATRAPYAGLTVGIYDKSEGSCARNQNPANDGISHNEYAAIVSSCDAEATATTDEFGEVTFYLPPGDYIVIGDDGTDKHLGVSASDCFAGVEMNKHLRKLNLSNGNTSPGKSSKHTKSDGAVLTIIEPEYVVWDGTEQLYPFIFEAEDEFGVTTSVAPPEGFVSDYGTLSTEVTNETEAVQFTITEVGSDLIPTETTFEIVHNGFLETVHSRVDIKLTPSYARQRGFDVATLRSQGLIFEPQDARPDDLPGRGPGELPPHSKGR